MAFTVQKFGGTSVDRMDLVGDIMSSDLQKGNKTVAVVSAFSGETNKLLKIADTVCSSENIYKTLQEFKGLFTQIVQGTVARARAFLDMNGIVGEQAQGVLDDIQAYLDQQVAHVEEQVAWAHEFFRDDFEDERKKYIVDRIVGLGEIFSAHVLARVFTVRNNVQRVFEDIHLGDVFDASQPPNVFKPDTDHEIDQELLYSVLSTRIADRVNHVMASGHVPIVTGYAGYIPGGILDTIDRGYTDSTAAMTARGLKRSTGRAEGVKLVISKEVDGLLSADPKIVGKEALLRRNAHFDEAAELSGLAGMKAINPHGIWVLDGEGVDIHVKNTFNPDADGTLISNVDDPESQGVRFISGKKGQVIYRVSSAKMIEQKGVAADIFQVCKQEGIPVDAITTSARTVAFSVDAKHAQNEHLTALFERYGRVEKKDEMAIICCIGNAMGDRKGLLSWLAGVLAGHDINIEFDGGDGDRNITFIVHEKDYERAIKALHQWSFYPNVRGAIRGAIGVVRNFVH